MFEAFADRRAPTSLGRKHGRACCKIVTVQTIRNGPVSANAKLSSFVAAVYALLSPQHFRIRLVSTCARSSQKAYGLSLRAKKPASTEGCFVASPTRQRPPQSAETPIDLDETYSKPWGKLRLLTSFNARKACLQGPRSFVRQLGGIGCLVFAEHWQRRRCHSQRSRGPAIMPAPPTCRSRPKQLQIFRGSS